MKTIILISLLSLTGCGGKYSMSDYTMALINAPVPSTVVYVNGDRSCGTDYGYRYGYGAVNGGCR
jgi:hypothetical protein